MNISEILSTIRKGVFEHMLFILVLFAAIPNFILSSYNALMIRNSYVIFGINVLLLLITFGSIILYRKETYRDYMIFVFSIFITISLSYYWTITGGVSGPGVYTFPTLAVLTIMMNRKRSRVFFTILLCGIVLLLSSGLLPISGEIIYESLLFDFYLDLIILTFIMVIFKRSLDKEQRNLRERNEQVDELIQELKLQTVELEQTNRQVAEISENLQHLISQRTEKLKEESELMVEYAFINAHLLRAPIANIMGLTKLYKQERPEVKSINKHIQELDYIIRKIGDVLK